METGEMPNFYDRWRRGGGSGSGSEAVVVGRDRRTSPSTLHFTPNTRQHRPRVKQERPHHSKYEFPATRHFRSTQTGLYHFMPSHACERCHQRKVKCDRAVPQCGPCKRSDVECRYAVTETQVRRRHVLKLEKRIRDLQASNDALSARLQEGQAAVAAVASPVDGQQAINGSLAEASASTTPQSLQGPERPGRGTHGGDQRNATRDVAEDVIQMSLIAGGEHNFVGSTSGLLLANLLRPRRKAPTSSSSLSSGSLLSPDSAWHRNNVAGRHGPNDGAGISALPPRSLAEALIRAYCSHDHLAYPFLSPRSLHKSLDAVYAAAAGTGDVPDAVDAFFVDMTLAIATAQVHKFNWSGVYNAETHCHRAMSRLGDVLARDGIERVQALLLICQYKMGTTSSDTSTSVWHLIGVAARTCLEMGLHRASTYTLPSGGTDNGDSGYEDSRITAKEDIETKKRCFWSLVALDRITSLALGRPLAIQLEDIDVDFPECGPPEGDEHVTQNNTPLSATYGTPQWSAATSIFVHIVKYRLICGKILNTLHRSSKHAPPPGCSGGPTTYHHMREKLELELKGWHAQTDALQLVRNGASAASPENSSSFRCDEWYQLLFHNGMLMLFRPSPVLCDAPRNSAVLQRIYDSSRETIHLYAHLHRSKKMNYSWVTMQYVFMAGLSYIYALRNHVQSTQAPSERWEEPIRSRLQATPTITQVVNSTRACSRVLVAVSERWDPARNCSDLFDRLSDAVISDIVDAQSAAPAAAAECNTTPQTPMAASMGQPVAQPASDVSMGLTEGDLGHSSFLGMTVDTAFRDCFGDLQNLSLDAFHNDALAQLSQGWYQGLEEDLNGFL